MGDTLFDPGAKPMRRKTMQTYISFCLVYT